MGITGTRPTLGEMGLERLNPALSSSSGSLPLNGGEWSIPHYQTFVSFMNMMTRSYWWTFDEALNDSICNSEAMRNDIVVRDALTSRYRSVCLLEWQLEPQDPTDITQKMYSQKLTKIFQDIPYFQQVRRNLMESVFFGKYGVQPIFKEDFSLGYHRVCIPRWYPVHGDKIVFKWDGTPGILVNAAYPGTKEYCEKGPVHFLTPEEEEGFIWHEFEPEDAAYNQPQYGGSVHGSGYRGRIYWYWWLKNNIQRFLMNFMKKLGNGYVVVGYNSGNPASKNAARTAIEGQDGNNVLYVPVNVSAGETIDKVIKHVDMNMAGSQMQWSIVTGINELIRQTILGESLTTQGAGSGGLNSNVAEQHGITADDRVRYDAQDLETPMQKLTRVLNRMNCPGNPCPTFKHLADKRNPMELMAAVDKAMTWGLSVPAPWVQEELGIPSPKKGEPILAQVQPMQATAVGNTPSGVPMAGPSGPMQQ
jgi:hypothetical protein